MKPIITVEGVSKRYTIGKKESYGSLRDEVMDAISSPFRRVFGGGQKAEDPSVWALRDVSFEVGEGDVLGIIGRNGAGKSTLLKILSRITEPTEGRIEMRGRMASLLEVGTGFHPELTGRENIFMNGALLGMTSAEIRAKFDEIVAFSEIENFLDTPVKRYSSGMYVRLAFAVAAHLEPEILVIDEVLAVGDAAFQKKCLGKMGEVAKGGRTVLFVSHNMGAVQKLCTKGIYLEKGELFVQGNIDGVLEEYLNVMDRKSDVKTPIVIKNNLKSNSKIKLSIKKIEVFTVDNNRIRQLNTGDSIKIIVTYISSEKILSPALIVSCRNQFGIELFRLSTMPISGFQLDEINGKGCFELLIHELPLLGGSYFLDISIARESIEVYFTIENAIQLNIAPTDCYNSGLALCNDRGLIRINHEWHHMKDSSR